MILLKYVVLMTASFLVTAYLFYYVTSFEEMKPLLEVFNILNIENFKYPNNKQLYCSINFAFILTATIIIIDIFLHIRARVVINKLNKQYKKKE